MGTANVDNNNNIFHGNYTYHHSFNLASRCRRNETFTSFPDIIPPLLSLVEFNAFYSGDGGGDGGGGSIHMVLIVVFYLAY